MESLVKTLILLCLLHMESAPIQLIVLKCRTHALDIQVDKEISIITQQLHVLLIHLKELQELLLQVKIMTFLEILTPHGEQHIHTDMLPDFLKMEDQFMAHIMTTAKCMLIAMSMCAMVQ